MIANYDFYHVAKGLVTNVRPDKKKVVKRANSIVGFSLIPLAMKDVDCTEFALRATDLLPINKTVNNPTLPHPIPHIIN